MRVVEESVGGEHILAADYHVRAETQATGRHRRNQPCLDGSVVYVFTGGGSLEGCHDRRVVGSRGQSEQSSESTAQPGRGSSVLRAADHTVAHR